MYHKLVTIQQGLPLKAVESKNGGEYKSNIFQDYCQSNGTQLRFRIPYNPRQNSRAEQRNLLYMDANRSMLNIAYLSHGYWEEEVSNTCYVSNITYSRSIQTTPFHLWFGKNPN